MYKVGIEAGGTKFIVAIFDNDYKIIDQINIKTTTPDETMGKVCKFLSNFSFNSIGIGCFGPIELDITNPKYGYITNTPKSSWIDFNIVGYLKEKFDVYIGFDTDVNAACLAEVKKGIAVDCSNVLYITIGTGIGGGIMSNGNLLHGLLHPEVGHVSLKRHPDDTFEGVCPYHSDCFEGLCSGPALFKRYGIPGEKLPIDHEAWKYQAYYIGQALANYILVLSPEMIILGGGVMQQQHLLKSIKLETQKALNGYVASENITKYIDNYIVIPKLFPISGLVGACILGEKK